MTTQLIDGALTDWDRLIDPPADHADEAASYQAALEQAVPGDATTLLELGCGGGHDASCEHLEGDMRTLRLGRTSDADGNGRSLRGVSWQRDPDPGDATYVVDHALLRWRETRRSGGERETVDRARRMDRCCAR